MRYLLILSLLLLFFPCVFAQKKTLTDTSYKSWTEVKNGLISNDGKYAAYVIDNKPLNQSTLILIATDLSWKEELVNHYDLKFSKDSKFAFAKTGDTLVQIQLGGAIVSLFPACVGYQLMNTGSVEWLIYEHQGEVKHVVVKRIDDGTLTELPEVLQVFPVPVQGSIVVRCKSNQKEVLKWVNLKSGKSREIYCGSTPQNIIVDKSGLQIAFRTVDSDTNYIWTYRNGDKRCKKIVSDSSPGIQPTNIIQTNDYWTFSDDGKHIFFTQEPKSIQSKDPTAPIIWNYKDAYLASRFAHAKAQLFSGRNLTEVNLENLKVRQLLEGAQKPVSRIGGTGDVFVFCASSGDESDYTWDNSFRTAYFVCNFKTGTIVPLKLGAEFPFYFSISPGGNVIVYYDWNSEQILSYFPKSGRRIPINTHGNHYRTKSFFRITKFGKPVFIGWQKNERYFLLQDEYDLWKIQPENKFFPVNVTKAKGSVTKTIYTTIEDSNSRVINDEEDIVIMGFETETKNVQFCKINLKNGKFRVISTKTSWFAFPYQPIPMSAIKRSAFGEGYLVYFETVDKSGNYYFTKNLLDFVPLSNEFPENQYNWITSELITYSDSSGIKYQAAVYKPADFNYENKYPVIFQYYINSSNELNKYIYPSPPSTTLNIPLMVSKGYIVVKPDIINTSNKLGTAALISVIASANYMCTQAYVDSLRLGIIGHSLGGFETNYIVTHSKKFAAVVSEAGTSNVVQMANETWPADGNSFHGYMSTVMGFDGDLDSIPHIYIDQSPILFARNVTSPILIFHNKEDNASYVSQSVQLFVQLRRLKRPVWMVQYPGEQHSISNIQYKFDHQKKLVTFFDHFLKKTSLPDWMNKPITVK
jgi:dipeptidyl aminopeptidase/acylaminoacyl peptidase